MAIAVDGSDGSEETRLKIPVGLRELKALEMVTPHGGRSVFDKKRSCAPDYICA